MLQEPAGWESHYHGMAQPQALLRQYSYSDRVRYYWQRPVISAAVQRLVANFLAGSIPKRVLSRYLPRQYDRLRAGEIDADAASLIVDRVKDVVRVYADTCSQI